MRLGFVHPQRVQPLPLADATALVILANQGLSRLIWSCLHNSTVPPLSRVHVVQHQWINIAKELSLLDPMHSEKFMIICPRITELVDNGGIRSIPLSDNNARDTEHSYGTGR